MKLKLLFLLIVTSLGYSQTDIANFESATGSEYAVVSSAIPLDQSSAGSTAWNFNVTYENSDTSDEMTTATAQDMIDYLGSTDVLTTNGSTEPIGKVFLKKSGSNVELVGAESSGLTLAYSDSGDIGATPFSYNSPNINAVAGDFVFENGGTTNNGTFTGNINSQVDAYGTLDVIIAGLPSENYNGSVTRLKIIQNIDLNIPPYGVVANLIQTSYYYYAANGDLVFRTSTVSVTGGFTTSNTIIESLTTSTLGIEDEKINEANLAIYPNPVSNELNIDVQAEIQSISIVDLLGRQVLNVKTSERVLPVNQLKSGIYIVYIATDKGVFSRKFVKQ